MRLAMTVAPWIPHLSCEIYFDITLLLAVLNDIAVQFPPYMATAAGVVHTANSAYRQANMPLLLLRSIATNGLSHALSPF